jgi:hypothetical protein
MKLLAKRITTFWIRGFKFSGWSDFGNVNVLNQNCWQTTLQLPLSLVRQATDVWVVEVFLI